MRRFLGMSIAALPVFVCMLSGCNAPVGTLKPVVPLVGEILADKYCPEYGILESCAVPDKYGAVFILGEETDCEVFSSALLSCDSRDNIRGNYAPDGLLDFSGERICSVVDFAGGDYSSYPASGLDDSLATQMVRLSLLAIDTLCYMSPYDLKGLAEQPRAKIVLLASSYADTYGMYDVDSLFNASGCGVFVVNPLTEMKKSAFSKGAANVGVLAPAENLSSGLYKDCVAFPAAGKGRDVLTGFLDSYLAAGYSKPLDALIVDDYSVNCDSLASSLARIRSVMNEESVLYSPLISEKFRIIDPRTVVCSVCFDILRRDNLFAHRISMPRFEKYMTVRRPEMILIPYNERYIETE